MVVPVIDVGGPTTAEDFRSSLAPKAREVVDFRRGTLDRGIGPQRAELPFSELTRTVSKQFEPALAESQGLGKAIEVPPGEILAYSGFSDFADLVRHRYQSGVGCTAIAVDDSPGAPPLLAQTWDYKKFFEDHSVVLKRNPESGLESAALTTALGHAYMGVNESGVAVLINNMQSRKARMGLPFSVVVHKILGESNSARQATNLLERADLMSAHNYLIGGPNETYNVEAGPERTVATRLETDQMPWAHTNHTLHDELEDRIVDYSDSSRARLDESLRRLRTEGNGKRSDAPLDVPGFFADHTTPLCRHGKGSDETATIGAVWITRDPLKLHVLDGTPCSHRSQEVELT